MNSIKSGLQKIKAVFEAYGDEPSRDTFRGELNYEAGKLYFALLISLVAWLSYIPIDLKLHQYPLLAVFIRGGLSAVSAVLIALKFTRRFRNRPAALILAMILYLNFATAVITATAGVNAGAYIGGFSIVFMVSSFAPFTFNAKAVYSALTLLLFFAIRAADSRNNLSNENVVYALNDLLVTFALSMLMSGLINNVKYRSWSRRQELKAASKAKTDFLAKVSHEIRTPMNAITGMAELALRENVSPPSAREHILTIKQSSANLLSLINDILDVSKIESGKLEIAPAEYHFASLIHDVVSIIRMRVIDSPVRFTVNIDGSIPSVLYGDKARVRQIMLNILSNAVKYTKVGRIALTVNGKVVDEDTVMLSIAVSDTGRGIREEDIDKLFEHFVQVDTEYNRGIEGTGLGLVISKNLAAAMGGGISVASEYGKGSTFTVTLPQTIHLHEPSAAVERPEQKNVLVYDRNEAHAESLGRTLSNLGVRFSFARSGGELYTKLQTGDYNVVFVEAALHEDALRMAAELGGKAQVALLTDFGSGASDDDRDVIVTPAHAISVANVLNGVSVGLPYHTGGDSVIKFIAPDARALVVDDIKTNLEVTKGLLSPYEMRVDTCLSGAEAILLVRERDYDIVLMDHMMPEMNGLEAMKRIRAMGGACAKLPIVALTANAVAGIREMLLQNGFDDFLSKPVDTADLNAALENWLPKDKQQPAVRKAAGDDGADFSIEGVNVKAGIARVGGSAATYLRTLSVFCGDGREKIAEIRKCLEDDNLPLFTINVHALKGAAANIGAAAFSELAKELEMAGKREDRAFIRSRTSRLLEDLEKLLRGIEETIAAEKGKQDAPGAFDREAVKTMLGSLTKAIDDFDIDAINKTAGELRRLTEMSGEIETVLHKTLIGEHDEAVSLIEKILRDVRHPVTTNAAATGC